MGQLKDLAAYFLRYIRQVLPEARRQLETINEKTVNCIPASFIQKSQANDGSMPGHFSTDKLCSLLFTMIPGVEAKGFVTFILSLYALDEALDEYRRSKGIYDELEIRKLMGCLSAAADPSRSLICDLKEAAEPKDKAGRKNKDDQKDTVDRKSAYDHMDTVDRKSAEDYKDAANLKMADDRNNTAHIISWSTGKSGIESSRITPVCHAERCRLQLAVLPSFKLISGKIKKYIQFYIDLQAYRHYPAVISTNLLKTWSSNYLKRYNEISWWEFCASADTFTAIAAMYAAASTGDVTADEVRLLDEACFPWLCGFVSMLDSVIRARAALGMEAMNFSSFYSNLKECEERILFLAERAESALSELKGGIIYVHLMKMAAGLYLSDPEASFGMLRIARSNIIRKCSLQTYCNLCSLIRFLRII